LDDLTHPSDTPPVGTKKPSLLDRLMAISRASVLEEMASGIAHELNQPLGAIVTFAQAGERILNRPDMSPQNAREVFQLISKEALAAAEGIRRIRRLFTPDSLSRTRCSMEDVVRELEPILEVLATPLGIRLALQVDGSAPLVNIDRLRIQHVLFTLAQNAFEAGSPADHTRPSEVRIAVTGDRYGVDVSVSDAGPGIPADRQAQIFHPFYTTKANGTGLGLASARAIIEAHEGSIGFENLEPRGTRFWFRLPASETV
jgi:C4-dicarboxylate-specific signal transduction histidine kinase